jgi:hypothetical protein
MNLMDWHAAQWGAFGQVGALVVAIVAGILVYQQVRQGRDIREDQTRPYVVVDFEFTGQFVSVAVKNIGTTPARDVRFHFEPSFQQHDRSDPEEVAVFRDGIPMVAPGRRIAIPYGNGPDIYSDDQQETPVRYDVLLTYTDLSGKRRYDDPPMILDLTPFKHSLVDREDLHQIYQNIKGIKELMKSWTSERRLKVNTITQAEVSGRQRQLLERQQEARRAQIAEDQAAQTDDAE